MNIEDTGSLTRLLLDNYKTTELILMVIFFEKVCFQLLFEM